MARTDLIDDEGENRALRSFLMQYSCNDARTVGQMLSHMRLSGWGDECVPAFAKKAHRDAHLTNAGAQIWIRHLLDQERAPPPSTSTAEDEMPPLPRAAKRGDLPRPWEYYTADQMLAYGQECARAALLAAISKKDSQIDVVAEQRGAEDERAKAIATLKRFWSGGYWEGVTHSDCTKIDEAFAALSANAADREAEETAARTLEGTRL